MIKSVMCHINNNAIIRVQEKNGTHFEKLKGRDMNDYFMGFLVPDKESMILWVQDLRLYAESIIELFYRMGFNDVTELNPSVKNMPNRSFKYAIEIKGNAYYVYIRNRRHTTYIYNADNLLANLSNQEILDDFGYKQKSGDKLTDLVNAMSQAIARLDGFQEKRTPFTISMLAMRQWKKIEDLYYCNNLIDCREYASPDCTKSLAQYLRESYHGGWNYLNSKNATNEQKNISGTVYDVNSLYPFIMATKALPWGEPENFTGGEIPHKDDPHYYYYVRVRMKFNLKDGAHFPYIQKRGDFRYNFMDYLETSDILKIDKSTGELKRITHILNLKGEREEIYPEFVFSKTDYELIHRHYDIIQEEIIDGVVFRTAKSVFKHYVNYYYDIKREADKEGMRGEKRIAKMLLNALSGTLAKRERRNNIIFYENENGKIDQKPVMLQNQNASYIYIASALLSYAREYTYEVACANADNFIYADTDSIHIYGAECKGIEVDQYALGKWKVEKTFDASCYMKKKSYVHEKDGRFYITMAGIAYGYKTLIEDIMNGSSTEDIKARAKLERYREASDFLYKRMESINNFAMRKPGEKNVKGYTDYFMKFFKPFFKEFYENPDVTTLQYEKYPSGITLCENFILHHEMIWEQMECFGRYTYA